MYLDDFHYCVFLFCRLLPSRKSTFIFLQILKSSIQVQSWIDEIETVIITINLHHARRGDLEMILESPSGTASPILTRRPYDNKTSGFDHWDFVSLHFWGEDPEGIWKLEVLNHNARISGYIDYISMMLFGTGKSWNLFLSKKTETARWYLDNVYLKSHIYDIVN